MARTGPNFRRYIESITVTNAGSGYDSSDPPTLFISPPNVTDPEHSKTQATGSITINSNVVDTLTITEPGDGYLAESLPSIYLVGKLTGFVVTSDAENGADSTRTAGTYNAISQASTSGAGAGAVFNVVIDSDGSVSAVTLSDAGSNKLFAEDDYIYLNNNQVGGDGTGNRVVLQVSTIASGSGATFTSTVNYINRPQKYFHQNFSYVVPYTIPEFIRDDYPKFAKFIETYFNFLDADEETVETLGLSGNSSNYALQELIDRLGINQYHPDFLSIYLQQYAIDFPEDKEMDTGFLVKRIREFYEAKGSRKGIQTFFKAVYGEDVDIVRPSEFLLIPSDGNWSVEVTAKVYANDESVTTQNPNDLIGKKVDIVYYTSTGSITARNRVNTSASRIKKIAYTNPSAFEVTLDLPPGTELPGPGVEADLVAVIGGKIASVDTISAADGLRTAGTYDINSGFTTDGNGTGAEFTVVVDGSGAATITVDTVGDDYAPDETITIPDSLLGSGGAANLTFDVATITDGKIFSVTIGAGGQGYFANPNIVVTPNSLDTITTTALIDARVSDGQISNTVFVNNTKGLGYNNIPTLTVNTDLIRTWIGLETVSDTLENKVGFLNRVLNEVTIKSNSGASDGGFKVGQAYPVQETGDILGVYAIDYFLEDYTLTGIENDAYVRIRSIDSNNYPTAIEIISTGVGFQRASFDFVLRSPTDELTTITCTTGLAHSYPGTFQDAKGFLSDVNKLQDNAVNQKFSYQIRSSLPKSEWGEALTRAGHPAGMIAFSDLQINHSIDFSSNINIVPDIFVFRLFANVEVIELSQVVAKDVHKPTIADTFSTQDDEASLEPGLVKNEILDMDDTDTPLDIGLNKTDVPDIQDEPALDVHKPTITDSVDWSQTILLLKTILRDPTETLDMDDSDQQLFVLKVLVDVPDIQDEASLDVGLNKTDTPDVDDDDVLAFGKITPDTPSVGDSINKFDVAASRSDTPDVADTGQLIVQNYAGDYFAEDYVGDSRSF